LGKTRGSLAISGLFGTASRKRERRLYPQGILQEYAAALIRQFVFSKNLF
jgi:hypothetical protein